MCSPRTRRMRKSSRRCSCERSCSFRTAPARAGRLDVPDDVALDDDGATADLRRDLGAFTDVEGVARRDLAGEGAVDPDLALKRELALELRPFSERRVEIAAACARMHVPLVLLHFPFRLRLLGPRCFWSVCMLGTL